MSGTITNCYNLFNQAQNLISIDLTNFNTNNVTDMSDMFGFCYNLTGNIPNFNTSKVINMKRMFYGCSNLTGNIPNFNTNNVTNMVYMFGYCSNLTGGNFNFTTVSKVTNMAYMFYRCNNLNQNALNSIYNMCINATSVSQKNLSNSSPYSPLYDTKFNNSYIPSSFKTRLTAAGWTY